MCGQLRSCGTLAFGLKTVRGIPRLKIAVMKINTPLPCRTCSILPSSQDTREETFDCYHAKITPTRVLFDGPFPERTSRVVRSYAGYTSSFLRVSFVDEDCVQYRFDRDVDGHKFIKERFGESLLNGIGIAERRFEFLAYSQSGLKQHSVWFVTPFWEYEIKDRVTMIDAETIIARLGTFHGVPHDPDLMKCPARYGARIAQAFTTTEAAVDVEVEEMFPADDIMDADDRRSFTDGVGLMFRELALDIWCALQHKSVHH